MHDAIESAREAYLALSARRAVLPHWTRFPVENRLALIRPGFDPGSRAITVKAVTVGPDNPLLGLPVVQGVVLMIEEATMAPVALMEGTFLSEYRTGAAVGLSTQLLSLPDANTVALFGAGAVARTSLWAICSVRQVREVRVVHPHAERFPLFESAMRDFLGNACPALRRVETPADALRDAQIVVAATTSATPVFPGEALEQGTFVAAIGSYTPTARELDTETILRSRLIVDSREAALREPGDILLPLAEGRIAENHIWAELGEVISGRRPGRQRPDEIVTFKSVGSAVQDITLATRVYALARERGLGTTVEL